MDQLATLALYWIPALISLSAAVFSVSAARRPASVQMQEDLGELAGVVEKLMKEQRRERMRRVRSAGEAAGSDNEGACGAQGSVSGVQQAMTKEQLRVIARQRGAIK